MDIVFARDPDRPDLRLVEIQDGNGHSIKAGMWIERPGDYTVLRIPDAPPAKFPEDTPASGRINQLVNHYLAQVTGAQHAYDADPTYHYHLQFLRRMLTVVDEAMATEGMPVEARTRVARTVVYGTPDEVEAEARMERTRLDIEQLKQAPSSLPLTLGNPT